MTSDAPRAAGRGLVAAWDRHQVPLFLAALVLGGVVGLSAPRLAPSLEHAIEPVLMLLLFATFLAVPLGEVGRAVRDGRFLATVLAANFVVVPVLAWALSRLVVDDRGLLLGVLLVLLTPCIDYVVVFTGLAGGARARLLAAAPLLMLLQLLLLPVLLLLLAGGDVLEVVDPAPFARAFVLLIVVPLVAAGIVQALARRRRIGRAIQAAMAAAMVPSMMATLAVVVASQIAAVGAQATVLVRVLPLYVAFVVAALGVGVLAGRVARLDVPGTRAVILSTSTRNSLVVLPLALALPPSLGIAPLAVVAQTLVELVALIVLVRLVPRLVPERGTAPT
ncbi:arsenic resistance protein [Agrococcus versicolor]|uniref:Arsenic resistance protein n=1 Tax=Agrococcus versicolor TaxID=501482 RepID=A0ABN3APV8_9MICO